MTSLPSASLAEPSLLGAQRPRLSHFTEYISSAGDEAIALAALAGLYLDDWQQFVLRHMLGERADGKWANPTVGLVVPRQNGKGSILEARELFGLFVLGERLINHTAHQQKTATNHFKRMLALIKGVPEFEGRIANIVRGKGSEAIELDGGQQIFFATRQGGGGRGLTADVQVYDEAMFLSETDRSSLTPTMAALSMHGNVQTLYAGSAVDKEDPSHDGVPFAQVRAAGMAKTRGVAFFEWSAPGDDPAKVTSEMAADPHMQAMANPGRGIRISGEWIEHERTVGMGARGFAVERLGVGDWPDITEDNARVIGVEVWRALRCFDPSKRIVGPKTFGIDVNPDRTWGSIGVAGPRDDGLEHVAVVDRQRGTKWIVPRCVALSEESEGARFVIDKRGPAANLIDDMKDAGLEVIEADAQDYGDACSDWIDAATNATMRYPVPQPDLDAAMADARKTRIGDSGAPKWSRKSSTSADITPLVACTLARWGSVSTSAYTTLLLPGRSTPEEEREQQREALGPQLPVVISPEDYTTCFRCLSGSSCPQHQN